MTKALELIGKKFGRWTVIRRVENSKKGRTCWFCECECGTTSKVLGTTLVSEDSKSCGCLGKEKITNRNFKHGHATRKFTTRTYQIWCAMYERCTTPAQNNYKWYGGRGISVCKRWDIFENFLSDMGEAPEGLTIDRKNNDGNYELDNCRWATYVEQARNRSDNKLTQSKVKTIKKLLKNSRYLQREIGEIFNVTQTMISAIKIGKTWKDINYP